MSRKDFDNEFYRFSVGVDRITSVYFQVWLQPHEERDVASIAVDNLGVRIYEPIPVLTRLLATLERRFDYARKSGNQYPNVDEATICQVARLLGFSIDHEIYEIVD